MYSGFQLQTLGKDYGNIEHHQKYTKIVHEHIKQNGKVTYPKFSDEYKKVRKQRAIKKETSAILIQYIFRKYIKLKKTKQST